MIQSYHSKLSVLYLGMNKADLGDGGPFTGLIWGGSAISKGRSSDGDNRLYLCTNIH